MTPDSLPEKGKERKRIPIAAAKRVAQEQGLRQVLLIGWDGERTHIVTYGATKADCSAAAKAQEFWQGHIREFSFDPARAARIAALEAENKRLREALGDYACAGSPDECRQQKLKDGSCVRMDCGRAAHDALKLSEGRDR